jgi:hypothetical protein
MATYGTILALSGRVLVSEPNDKRKLARKMLDSLQGSGMINSPEMKHVPLSESERYLMEAENPGAQAFNVSDGLTVGIGKPSFVSAAKPGEKSDPRVARLRAQALEGDEQEKATRHLRESAEQMPGPDEMDQLMGLPPWKRNFEKRPTGTLPPSPEQPGSSRRAALMKAFEQATRKEQ